MEEKHRLVTGDFFSLDQINQTGHRFARIDRGKKNTLSLGNEFNGFEAGRGRNAITGADVIVVNNNVGDQCIERPEIPICEFCYPPTPYQLDHHV